MCTECSLGVKETVRPKIKFCHHVVPNRFELLLHIEHKKRNLERMYWTAMSSAWTLTEGLKKEQKTYIYYKWSIHFYNTFKHAKFQVYQSYIIASNEKQTEIIH